MTYGFAFLTIGTILTLSGWSNRSIKEVLQGVITPSGVGPGENAFAKGAKEIAAGLEEGATGGGGGGGTGTLPSPVKHKSKNALAIVLEHPELKPGIAGVLATVLTRFPELQITATTGGSHVGDSRHYEGRAVDLAGSTAYMNKAAKWCARYLTPSLDEGIHNPGLSVDTHHPVPSSFWGASTWAAHANHIHLAV